MSLINTGLVKTAPVLRWAGSKRWLVRRGIATYIGDVGGTYYEPFLGSASVFLALEPARAVLADVNAKLMNFYRAVQLDADGVADQLDLMPAGEEFYYHVRAGFPDADQTVAAAQFVYLNTFGFNGLYRENSKGIFNVPYGRPKNDNVPTRDSIIGLASRLHDGVSLNVSGFAESLKGVTSGDTVYLDPPYVSACRATGFVDYNQAVFTWADQILLVDELRRLDRIGARVYLSNADHASVRELYHGFDILELSRHSSMAGRKESRGHTREILVTNAANGATWPD